MKLPLAFFLTASVLAGCGSGNRIEPVKPPEPSARLEHADEIVAIVNGQPVTWRAVAEKMLELDLKTAVDQYVRWRLLEDRKTSMGIRNPPEELKKRAEVYAREARRQMGEEAFRSQIEREGTTAEAWVTKLAGSRFLDEILTMDKILRYNSLLEDQLETDRMIFVDEGDAARFVESAKTLGFDKAAEELEKAGRKPTLGRMPREVFAPDAPPSSPVMDEWVVEALRKLRPGEFTGVEHSRSNLHYVVLLRNLRKGRKVPYDEVKGELLDGILAEPPAPAEYRRWMDRELAKARVEYREPKAAPGRGR